MYTSDYDDCDSLIEDESMIENDDTSHVMLSPEVDGVDSELLCGVGVSAIAEKHAIPGFQELARSKVA